MAELKSIKPAVGFEQVLYPGENSQLAAQRSEKEGIEIVDEIYHYLNSDVLFNQSYDNKNPFAS